MKFKWFRWLVLAVLVCAALLGGAFLLEGVGYFRDIERTEKLLIGAWISVAAISIFVTIAASMLKKK